MAKTDKMAKTPLRAGSVRRPDGAEQGIENKSIVRPTQDAPPWFRGGPGGLVFNDGGSASRLEIIWAYSAC